MLQNSLKTRFPNQESDQKSLLTRPLYHHFFPSAPAPLTKWPHQPTYQATGIFAEIFKLQPADLNLSPSDPCLFQPGKQSVPGVAMISGNGDGEQRRIHRARKISTQLEGSNYEDFLAEVKDTGLNLEQVLCIRDTVQFPKFYKLRVLFKNCRKPRQILLCKFRNCRRKFRSTFALEIHLASHDNLRLHKCGHCKRSFT